MESNQLKTLNVDWLGHCPTCEREQHTVSTSEGNKDYLYEDDTVKCWCGQTGVIETDGEGHAWCNWDKKAATEWDNFNLYYRQKFPEYWDLLPKANHQACQHHEELFNTWLAAKSQAVPEKTCSIQGHEIIINETKNELINDCDIAKEDEYLLEALVYRGVCIGKSQAMGEKDAIIKKLSDQLYAQEMKTSAARVLCETACELLDEYAHQDAMVILNDLEQAMIEAQEQSHE